MIGHLVKRVVGAKRRETLADLDEFFKAQSSRIHREILAGKQEDIAVEVCYPREDFVLMEHRR